ncbi:uncharacterized protein B0P05DRAFT_641973 [Gilbertella persicaria]|uniref:uncharacterized protein n=1 Tax=Gilbertella persicaria TaxID=101096 RepID=UPI00221F5A8D|nr:uncharacterized protein B0P05DRAFT_641973 [Gilbertella persicaria]KAI8048593.1 hypothetical protein B0P05DRAFT_641973 [Gilbertella persicaria]
MSSIENNNSTISNNDAFSNKKPEEHSASLKQILARSKLTNNKILPQELPTIERGLNQIESQSQKLSFKTTSSDEGVDVRAHYFLAQGGVNTHVLMKELGTIHLGGLEEHRQPIQDTDIEKHIEQQSTETVIKVIEDGRQEIMDETNQLFEKDLDSYWSTLLNNTLKVNAAEKRTFNLSKTKFDQTRVVPAGHVGFSNYYNK